MDYKKAYKAVLKTATQWIKDGCTDKEKICLECVFPELRESQDERIRKEILEYFRQFETDGLRGVDIADWIAWLEKQKDCEAEIEKAYKNADRMQYKKGFEDGIKQQITAKSEDGKIIVEKAESEDEKIRKGLLDIFKESQNGYWAGMEIKDIVAWLEKQKAPNGSPTPDLTTMLVPNRYNEQKPAEWGRGR